MVSINSVPSTTQAIMAYISAIVQELSENIKRLEEFKRRDKSFEEYLFKTYLPETKPQPSQLEFTAKKKPRGISLSSPSFCVKRRISDIFDKRPRNFLIFDKNIPHFS